MSHIVKPPCDDGVIQMAPEPTSSKVSDVSQGAIYAAKSNIGLWVLVAH
jgi:hypothetical protein